MPAQPERPTGERPGLGPWPPRGDRHMFAMMAVVFTVIAVSDAFFVRSGGTWAWFHYLGDATIAVLAIAGWSAVHRHGRTSEHAGVCGYLLDLTVAVVWAGYFLQSVQHHSPDWFDLLIVILALANTRGNRRGRDKTVRILGYKAKAALAKLAHTPAPAPSAH